MFAFVLMPFDAAFDDIYRLGIKETAEKLGIVAERVDEQIFHKQNILERIYDQIHSADFIISDMTGRNPNVFYETGYAHAKGKICLLLTSNADDIPFDLKHHRHIIYGSSIQNLRQALQKDLEHIKAEVENRHSVITLGLARSEGLLKKTKYAARGNVDLYFDMKNNTNSPSPEIEAIYFHTGAGWSFIQDGQECPTTESTKLDYTIQHFIRTPVPRLSAGAWAQIKIAGSKILAYALAEGEVLKNEYRLTGRAIVTLVTADGAFDYPIDIDVQVDEIPF